MSTAIRVEAGGVMHDYHGILMCLKDWQSLLAGLSALIAAIVASVAAYCVGKRQASAIEKQNDDMRERECSALAREIKKSANLFITLLKIVSNNIEDTIKDFEQNWHPELFKNTWKPQESLTAPPLYQVLNHLVKLDVEVIEKYFLIRMRADQFRAEKAPVREDLIHQLKDILRIASDLREDMVKRYDKI
jgi:hypothetical protein